MKVLSVVGTRPNLMKTGPVVAALARRGVDQILVHTGQHYDDAMSHGFFRDLGIPEPDVNLEVGEDKGCGWGGARGRVGRRRGRDGRPAAALETL